MDDQHPEPEDLRRITVSFETSRNLGQYENAKLGVYLSGLRPNASQEEIDEMIRTSEFAFGRITAAINKHADAEKAHAQAEKERVAGKPIPPRPQSADQRPRQPNGAPTYQPHTQNRNQNRNQGNFPPHQRRDRW